MDLMATMDDVISLSSGSDADSDLEVVGCYSDDTKEDTRPFVRRDWVAVKPVVIDLSKLRRRRPQSCLNGSIEIVDLSLLEEAEHESDVCITVSDKEDTSLDQQDDCQILPSPTVETNQSLTLENPQGTETSQKPCLLTVSEALTVSEKGGNGCQFEGESLVQSPAAQNSHQNISVENSQKTDLTEESLVLESELPALEECSSHKDSLESIPSPFYLDSPYGCPSDIDAGFFPEESNILELKEPSFTKDLFDHPAVSSCVSYNSVHPGAQTNSPCATPSSGTGLEDAWEENEHLELSSSSACLSDLSGTCPPTALPSSNTGPPQTETRISCTPNSPGRPDPGASEPIQSPVTTDHPYSISSRQSCLSYPLPERECEVQEVGKAQAIYNGLGQVENRQDDSGSHVISDFGAGTSGQELQQKQYISHIQLRKLKKQMGVVVKDQINEEEEEEEEEDYGPPELLCRQSLSLVYSTIEENYPEGTLQLLSDFLQPRYYPPPDITAHLLRGILMDPHCPDVLALEAYSLLMRIQIFHPSDLSTLPWDWEMLTAVMDQEESTRRLRLEVRRMLLQYVLQILEDDFQRHLCLQRLHLTITKTMLSCEQRFTHVRELIGWLFEAVSMAVRSKDGTSPKRERNDHLKMVMIFQKMLVLAMEVDRTPACSSNKLSQELFHTIISSPNREQRILLLDTLESSLLKCKLLELLLEYQCPEKTPVPMSRSLLLHFLQYSSLPSDPKDGTESWRRWEELMQLIWMLLLSYEEVMRGHLRCAVTERSTYSRAPSWTVNDGVTEAMVQDAAAAFVARAERDLGFALPPHLQESLALLQEHLLDAC